MKTVRNYNIDGKPRIRKIGDECDLSFIGDRDIVRDSETPMQAGNVGGENIKDFIENYFFNNKPLFTAATIFMAIPKAIAVGDISGSTYIINGFSIYIEIGYYYNVTLEVKITPNDEEDITGRHIEDDLGTEIYSFDANNDSYVISNYNSIDKNYKAKMSVSNNTPGYTVKTSNKVYVYSIPSILMGVSLLDDLTGFNPYDNGFERNFKKLSPGSSFDVAWETERGYHYLLIPDTFPNLSDVLVAGLSFTGAWNDLNPYAVLTIDDSDANVITANTFKVYRTTFVTKTTMGNPMNYTFKF